MNGIYWLFRLSDRGKKKTENLEISCETPVSRYTRLEYQ